MTGLALFLTLALAKLAAMSGHGIPLSAWGAVVYVWQDALIALVFGTVQQLAPVRSHYSYTLLARRAAGAAITAVYWTLVAYAAVNIPVGRVLATPLTWPMLRAARGALTDSVLLYVTWTNAILMLSTMAAGALLPRMFRRLPSSLPRRAMVCVPPIVAIALLTGDRVDTHGRHRNSMVALVQSSFPHVRSGDVERTPVGAAFRRPPVGAAFRRPVHSADDVEDLSRFRGAVTGRNVVLVSLESTAAQYLPLYGGPDDVVPALGALARDSIVFEHAYAAYPESIKGLFSILCSTFPAFDVEPEMLGRLSCPALPAMLQDAGYATGLFHSGRFDYLGMEAIIGDRGFDILEDAGHIGGNHRSSFGVDEPSTVARILAWVDGLPRDQPFFVTYLPIAGHHPYETPSRGVFSNDDEFGRYRNALRYGDASLGALVNGLRTRGVERNTVWIILGDHGEAFGQHEGNYGHTFFLYDENIRVPFVISAPGVTNGQTRVSRVVSLVDTAPTILDLLGVPIPERYQGHTMLDGAARMAMFFTDYSLPLAGLRDGPWKVVHELDAGRTRLFDLVNDPGETRDLSASFPTRAAWYAEALRGWSSAQKRYVKQRAGS